MNNDTLTSEKSAALNPETSLALQEWQLRAIKTGLKEIEQGLVVDFETVKSFLN